MNNDTKRALERAGLQLVSVAEALRELGEIMGFEVTPARVSWEPTASDYKMFSFEKKEGHGNGKA